jgi:hypothetical protein
MTPKVVISASLWGTAVFTVSAVASTAFPDALAIPSLVIDLVLFLLGCLAFMRALLIAAGRSRRDEIDLPGLFFLSRSAPGAVRLRLLGAFAVQVVVAITTAAIRPYTALAFGVLVPTYGLGLCGLWAAKAGRFPPRAQPDHGPAGRPGDRQRRPQASGRAGPGRSGPVPPPAEPG